MILEIVTTFLWQLVRFLSGGALWCVLAQIANVGVGVPETPYRLPASGIVTDFRHAAAVGEEILVIRFSTGFPRERALYREIDRLGPAGISETLRIRTPATIDSDGTAVPRGSDGFVAGESGWWYVALDFPDGTTAATTFIKSDGSRTTHLIPPTKKHVNWYLVVIPGQQPGVLEFTFAHDATFVRELNSSGVLRSWTLPPPMRHLFPRPHMTAERLPDGRIALFSIAEGLSMLILSENGEVEETVLRNVRIQHFDTAIDDAGRIGVVAARKVEGTIEAAVIDPENPDNAEWHTLRREVQVMWLFREIQVVTTPDGFAVAWIDESAGRRIEATQVDLRGRGGAVVEVGQASPREITAFFDLQAIDDELLFWWDDGEYLYQRRLPRWLTGYAFLRDLTERFCRTDEASRGSADERARP